MQLIFTLALIAAALVFLIGIRRALRMSKISVALIGKYEHDKNNPRLIEEIHAALTEDFLLNRILQKHGAGVEDISRLHKKLMEWGDFRKYNRYVPITSFFNVTTLEYLLAHKSDDAKALTEKMMNHFHL